MKTLKENTRRDYARRMDKVLAHIQANLDENLSLEDLATISCFSTYHFHRIFSGMVGESAKAYIRRLRLERAAGELKRTEKAVTTIAFEACFETHESFSRAFCRMFGVSPRGYRQNCQLELQSQNIIYWREIDMKVEIIELEALDVAYVRHTGPYDQCGTAWDELCQWAAPRGLLQPGAKMLGLSYDDPQITPPEKIRYDACLEIKEEVNIDTPIGKRCLEGGRYAMTTHFGPYDKLSETYSLLCGQWVPQNGYEIDNRECIEIYQNHPEDTEPEELITDIYVPLKEGV